ncbi:MAG: ion channel [Bacteroidota bacterium]
MESTIKQLWQRNNRYWNQERSLAALLVYLIISIVSWLPLSEENPWEEAFQDIIFNLIVLAGYFSASVDNSLKNSLAKQALLILAVSATIFRALEYINFSPLIRNLDLAASISYFGLLTYLIFRYVVRDDKEVTSHRVQGAVVVYLLVGLVSSFLYYLVYINNAASFLYGGQVNFDMIFASFIYFSYTVQTTVGASDMIPVGAIPKSLVIFQSIFGMIYPVVIIARLVSLEIEHSKNKK